MESKQNAHKQYEFNSNLTGTPPSNETTWKHVDRMYNSTRKQKEWMTELHIVTLNIYHYNRVTLEGFWWETTEELQMFLRIENNIHILCMQDTKLRKQQQKQFQKAFEGIGYNVYFTAGDSKYGCATAVIKGIEVRRITRTQCTVAKDIMIRENKRMRLINTYWVPHPDSNIHQEAKRCAHKEIKQAYANKQTVLMVGDPNKTKCRQSYAQTLALGMHDIPAPNPTYIRPHEQSTPDAIMANDELMPTIIDTEVYTGMIMFSDAHIPFGIKMNTKALRNQNTAVSLRKLMLNKTDIEEVVKPTTQLCKQHEQHSCASSMNNTAVQAA